MKEITIILTEPIYKLLGLQNSADDTAVAEALSRLADRAGKATQLEERLNSQQALVAKLETERDQLKKEAENAEVEQMLRQAEKEKRITAELKAQLREDYTGKPEKLSTILNGYRPFRSVTEMIHTEESRNEEERAAYAKMSYEELDKGEKLYHVKNTYPDLYEEKFRKKFGKEPS